MLTILQPPTSRRLITLDKAKAGLGISGNAQDAALLEAIDDVSLDIAAEIGQELGRTLYRRTFAGNDRPYLLLPERPLESLVGGVTFQGLPVAAVSVTDREMAQLFLEDGWTWTAQVWGVEGTPQPGTELEDYIADYIAGYLMPEQVSTWAASATAVIGAWLRPLTQGVTALLFQVTVAGALGTSEPTWPTDSTAPIVSGAATLAPFPAFELPRSYQRAAFAEIRERRFVDSRDPTLAAERMEAVSYTYRASAPAQGAGIGSDLHRLLSDEARRIVAGLKRRIL